MKNDDLFKRAGALGFQLFGAEESQDANLTLADMARSKDLRLWEGFAVALVNSADNGLFNYNKAKALLKKPSDKSAFDSLVALSLALYKFFNLKFSWAGKLSNALSVKKKNEFNKFLNKLKNNEEFKCFGKNMSSERLKSIFNNYFNQAQKKLEDFVSLKDEFSLEYALAQVFSPKQKELFYKKLKREKLTKTEKEYFSRTVKKKILALANPQLHSLSKKVLE